jgi:hypothetical protein
MTPEQRRVKMGKYRTRKVLRERNVPEETIERIVASVDWLTTTPSEVVSSFFSGDTSTRADVSELVHQGEKVRHQRAPGHQGRRVAQRQPVASTTDSDMPVWVPVAAIATVIGVFFGIPIIIAKYGH